jgi:hypothetical protein
MVRGCLHTLGQDAVFPDRERAYAWLILQSIANGSDYAISGRVSLTPEQEKHFLDLYIGCAAREVQTNVFSAEWRVLAWLHWKAYSHLSYFARSASRPLDAADCARALKLSRAEVDTAIASLESRGYLMTRGRKIFAMVPCPGMIVRNGRRYRPVLDQETGEFSKVEQVRRDTAKALGFEPGYAAELMDECVAAGRLLVENEIVYCDESDPAGAAGGSIQ